MRLQKRLAALETNARPAMHIAYARATGNLSALTDAELDKLISDLDAEIGDVQVERIRNMTDAELEVLASGGTNAT